MDLWRCGKKVYVGYILFSFSYCRHNSSKTVTKSRNFNVTDYNSLTKLVKKKKIKVPFFPTEILLGLGDHIRGIPNLYGVRLLVVTWINISIIKHQYQNA